MSVVAAESVEIRRVTPKQFGARLAALRESAGISQPDLARKLGVSQPTLSLWEAGERSPNFVMVVKIAQTLGVNVEEFAVIPDEIRDRVLGRPRKEAEEPESPKRGRGRPKKSGDG